MWAQMNPALDVKSCVLASLAQRGWTQVQVMRPGAKTSGKGVLYEKGNIWPTKAAETIPRKATSVPCWTRTRGRHTTDGFRAGAVKPVLAPVALSQGQQPLRFPSLLHSCLQWLTAGSQESRDTIKTTRLTFASTQESSSLF